MKPLTYKDLSSLSPGTRLRVVDTPGHWKNLCTGEVVTVVSVIDSLVLVLCRNGKRRAYFPERFVLVKPKGWMGCWLPKKEEEHA